MKKIKHWIIIGLLSALLDAGCAAPETDYDYGYEEGRGGIFEPGVTDEGVFESEGPLDSGVYEDENPWSDEEVFEGEDVLDDGVTDEGVMEDGIFE